MVFLKNLPILSPWPYRLTRIGLGLVFAWAGAVKLMDPRAFARVISGYGLVPEEMLAPIALGLPTIELLAGLGLIFNVRGCLKIIASLLTGFIALLGYAILNDMNVDCGCFSPEEIHAQNGLRIAFFRDLGLMGMVVYLFFWQWARPRRHGDGQCLE